MGDKTMTSKNFLMILIISAFGFIMPINASEAPAERAGGGSAGAAGGSAGAVDEAAATWTCSWIIEGQNTFPITEMRNWSLEEAIAHLQLTTTFNDYLLGQPWFIGFASKVWIDETIKEEEWNDALSTFKKSYNLPSECEHLSIIIIACIMHRLITQDNTIPANLELNRRNFETWKQGIECPICLNTEIENAIFCCLVPCGHWLHEKCLLKMLHSRFTSMGTGAFFKSQKFKCPTCRAICDTEDIF